ncbi:MAG TPA: NAD(P)-dependent oxidoreductase [Chloroflexota bacterium]|nr:NAD(P)-dependent oxidoreductase [Chloroflexota bacterium]
MRVIITGAGGLIGTNLALRVLDEGHEVFGVDVAPNQWTPRVPVHLQDLREPHTGEAWGTADVVVHLAARAKVHESVERPENALDNYKITHGVLEYCRRGRTPIIFGSSRETYGEQSHFPVPEDAARIEGAASPYAAAKLGEEALIRAYGRCFDVPHVIIRFSNVYGRYDNYGRLERMLPIFFDRLRRGEPIPIYGPQKAYDFTYIDDAIEGTYAAVRRLARDPTSLSGQTINLGTGAGTTLVDAARLAAKAVGVEPTLDLQDMRVGEISRYVADISKARALLNYDPQWPPERGIPAFYEWWATYYGSSENATATPAASPH